MLKQSGGKPDLSPAVRISPPAVASPLTAIFPAGRIERVLGKAPSTWTVDDLLKFIMSEEIRLLSLMHVGGDGCLKTLDFVPRDAAHFRTILNGGERADGSSLFPGIRAEASDVVLRPRLDTAFVDPFSSSPTLAVLCSHRGADGQPLPMSPDTIVRRAQARLRQETGIDLWALGEIEFFLGRLFEGERGYEMDDHGYHATSPFVFGEGLRRRALVHLGEMGVPVKYAHGEVGSAQTYDTDRIHWEQHEVELALLPLPEAADAISLAAWVLRNLAHREGVAISFDPLLLEGHAASGLHIHLSPRVGDQPSEVVLTAGELADPARWLIAGLVQMGGTLMAYGNRVPGSFTRLRQGREAPTSVTWGHRDRKALIRIPVVARDGSDRQVTVPTIEFRLPDGSALQHLLLAGLAQATVLGRRTEGIADLLERTAAGETDGGEKVPQSPAQVADSLERHRADLEAGGVFPPELIDKTIVALRSGSALA